MRILIVYRTENGPVGKSVKELKEDLEKKGYEIDLISRNEDLHIKGLSGSMDILKNSIIEKNKIKNYDMIYTQDWSIAFPLLFPSKVLFDKHYCLFHSLEKTGGAQSKILQKITGNLLGNHLFVKTEELKNKFPKSVLSPEGIIDFEKIKK